MSSAEKKIAKIEIDRELCIGAATCVALAPGVFALDKENKAYVFDANGADAEAIRLAAESCPTKAISLFDEAGNRMYPHP